MNPVRFQGRQTVRPNLDVLAEAINARDHAITVFLTPD
jgi:hypothetical protein